MALSSAILLTKCGAELSALAQLRDWRCQDWQQIYTILDFVALLKSYPSDIFSPETAGQ